MAKIILDKDLDTEFVLEVDSVFEDIVYNSIVGKKRCTVPPLPEVPALQTSDITSVRLESNEGYVLPVECTYNKVISYTTAYNESDSTYNISIQLGYKPAPVNA